MMNIISSLDLRSITLNSLRLLPADSDGDGVVSLSECNQTHPCQSMETHYDCEAGTWSSKSTVSIGSGPCTTWQQCVAGNGQYCGDECNTIYPPQATPSPTPGNDDEDSGDDDGDSTCEDDEFKDCQGDCFSTDYYGAWIGDDACNEGGKERPERGTRTILSLERKRSDAESQLLA